MPESKRHPARRPTQRSAKPSHKPASTQSPATNKNSAGSNSANKNSANKNKVYAPGWRGSLERASVGPLFFLNTLPRLLVPLMLGILMIMGLAMPWNWTGLVLLIPAAFLAWLMVLSWPLLSTTGKLMRAAAVIGLVIGCVLRVTGHL
ncbi:MAG: DUF6703 family protein [Actinomycetes bacterium]